MTSPYLGTAVATPTSPAHESDVMTPTKRASLNLGVLPEGDDADATALTALETHHEGRKGSPRKSVAPGSPVLDPRRASTAWVATANNPAMQKIASPKNKRESVSGTSPRRGSATGELASSPSSRRGSATGELASSPSSRRGSATGELASSPSSRRGSATGELVPAPPSRRGSATGELVSAPSSRRGSATGELAASTEMIPVASPKNTELRRKSATEKTEAAPAPVETALVPAHTPAHTELATTLSPIGQAAASPRTRLSVFQWSGTPTNRKNLAKTFAAASPKGPVRASVYSPRSAEVMQAYEQRCVDGVGTSHTETLGSMWRADHRPRSHSRYLTH